MIIKFLHWKRAAFSVLFTLLLSVAGVTNAFAQTFTMGNLNYSINSDGATVTVTGHVDGTNATGELVIPESVELYGTTYPVTVIGSSAFSSCTGLTGSLVIPNSVITIGDYAFVGCSGFTSLTLGSAVQNINSYAFRYCYGLTGTLTIPENVTGIGYQPFYYCGFTSLNYNATNCGGSFSTGYNHWLNGMNLTTLTIGENVQTIPGYFLYECTSFIGDLVIPESVTSIRGSAFSGCTGFTGSLTIGNSVASIGEYAFNGCTGFTGSLVIPESVTSIGSCAFRGCTGFDGSLTIGNSVTSIGSNAFYGCTGFTGSLVVPESVTSIGGSAFYGCTGFTGSLTIGNSVTSIGSNAFNSCSGFMGSLNIGNSVTSIGENAFNGCTGFTGSLTIPNFVNSIGVNAFSGCTGFSGTLTIGKSVTQIGNSAFFGACQGFTLFAVWPETPPTLGNNVFISADYSIPVQVPCGTLDAYQNAEGWNVFTNIQEPDPCLWEITATANPTTGGTVSGAGIYEQGQTCTLTATPNEGISFVNWTEDGVEVSTDAQYAFTVTGNRQLVANFVIPTYTVNVTVNPSNGGSIIIDGEGNLNICGFEDGTWGGWTTIDANGDGRDWNLFSHEGSGHNGSSYLVRSASYENGAITPDNYLVSPLVPLGGSVSFYACAHDVNWAAEHFGVAVSTTSNTNPNAFNMIQEWTMTAKRIEGQPSDRTQGGGNRAQGNWYEYTVDLSAYSGMSGYVAIRHFNCYDQFYLYVDDICIPAYTKVYQPGDVCTLNATPNSSDFVFVNWTENGEMISTSAQYSFTVTGNRNLVANFMRIRFDITATADPESCGTVSGSGNYLVGQTCTLTATPNEGYAFYQWLENGEVVSTNASYSFIVNADRTLTAKFKTANPIVFADSNVEALCLNNWDTDGDGFLSYSEAAAVTDLGSVFRYNSGISSFNELQYFTGLTSIGYRAFYNCYYLNSITLPNTVTSIGQQAFYNCYYLNSFTLPNSLVSIGSYAFYNCSSLSGSLVVPNSVTNIDSYAFSYCSGLTSVSLPSGMSYINGGVFYNCYNLSSISLPTSLYSIGSSAFYNCSALSSLTMPNSVTYIYDNAFEGCVSLASVGFSTSLYSIGYRAFYGCSGLTGTLELPNSVSLIGEEAFMDCTSITGLNLPTYLSSIGSSAFRNCSGIRGEITLPASLWSVGGYAFYGCDGFSTVNYNATNCSSFGSASNPVFYDCAFPHLNIGANVQRIPDNAFKRCFMITDMNVAAANPPTVYSSTFGMVPRSIPVTVPFGSGDAYRSAQYWEEFFNIIEDNGTVYTNYWQPNGSQYANNMSVIGIIQIDGVEQSTNALEIGAFCGDECRGSQLLTYYPQLNRYLVFFTLYGEEGDILFFRLYDHELDQESDLGCASYITFESNGILGTYSSPYVFNFAHIQNTVLDAGWTWFSTYVELNGLDGLSMMEESLGSNGLMIKSQSDGYASYSNTIGQWSGSLNSVNNEQMYMINISAPCVLNMTGSYAVPDQHPIVLSPGWTWIGYPMTSTTSINEALSGLNAQDGDVIKSKSSFSTYIEGVGWTGWLNTFNPSFGMMYYSQKNGPISFVYANGAKSGALLENLATESIHYVPERTAYPYNMTVIAVVELDGEELESETSELAVFANGECRGSAKLLYVEPLHRYLAFLTVSGKDDAELRFRLYNTETGEEYYDAEVNLNFRDNAMIGDTRNPFVVRFRSKTDLDECVNSVKLYPNPVASGECFHIGMNADLNAPIRVEIINALGVEVSCATTVQSPVTLNAPKAAGVYTLRITTEGKGSIVRKLMVR